MMLAAVVSSPRHLGFILTLGSALFLATACDSTSQSKSAPQDQSTYAYSRTTLSSCGQQTEVNGSYFLVEGSAKALDSLRPPNGLEKIAVVVTKDCSHGGAITLMPPSAGSIVWEAHARGGGITAAELMTVTRKPYELTVTYAGGIHAIVAFN